MMKIKKGVIIMALAQRLHRQHIIEEMKDKTVEEIEEEYKKAVEYLESDDLKQLIERAHTEGMDIDPRTSANERVQFLAEILEACRGKELQVENEELKSMMDELGATQTMTDTVEKQM